MNHTAHRPFLVALTIGLFSFILPVHTSSAQLLADSIADWDPTGTQGTNNWHYGYYNLTTDGDGIYQPGDFVAFLNDGSGGPVVPGTNHWTGSAFRLVPSNAPWTFLAQEQAHPNGTNSAPNEEHWVIRRWVSNHAGDVKITYDLRAQNTNGPGTTVFLFHNGVQIGQLSNASGTSPSMLPTAEATIAIGDTLDLALSPEDAGGDRSDGSDGSFFSMVIEESTDSDGDGLDDLWEDEHFGDNSGTVEPSDVTPQDGTGDPDGDGLDNEGEETNGTDPNNPDSDDDGFTDNEEVTNGSDPNNPNSLPAALALAESRRDWSPTGTPGENGWTNGYFNLTADANSTYEAGDFTPFLNDGSGVPETDPVEVNHWNGTIWDFEANPPWTELGPENTHPNGINNAAEHWTIRRWTSNHDGPARLIWHTREVNNGGTGVSGKLFIDGVEVDSAATDTTTGFTRAFHAVLATGQTVDLALTPVGPGGDPSDGADGSANWLWIDDRVGDCAIQPDGSFFVSPGAADSDGDTIPDCIEEFFFPGDLGQLSELGDLDMDGLSDSAEINTHGTDPTDADADGDGLNDGEEVLVHGTDPANADSDGDGCPDGYEVRTGLDPTDGGSVPSTGAIADSIADWPAAGALNPQGVNGWTYGYYNLTVDGPPSSSTFIPFPTDGSITPSAANFWDGNVFDWFMGNQPWTFLSATGGHPNGDNQPELHWAVRRWQYTGPTGPLALHYQLSKGGGGNGTTAVLLKNGEPIESSTIAPNGSVKSWFFVNAKTGDQLEIALSPLGTNGTNNDGSDSSDFSMIVNPTVPPAPFQPDGSAFVPLYDTYAQDFTGFGDGTTDLSDGSVIGSNDGTAQVQSEALVLTSAATTSTRASFRIPGLLCSSQGWKATFDVTMADAVGGNVPADGFSFNYGAIPAPGTGPAGGHGNAEEGFGGGDHISFEVDTWMNIDTEQGFNVAVNGADVPGGHQNTSPLANDATVTASVTIAWTPAAASFSTSGLSNDAALAGLNHFFAGSDDYTFAFSARTGGATEDLIIDNLVITTDQTVDSDGDGLSDILECASGIDPNDDGSVDPVNGPNGDLDGDGLTNGEEAGLGTNLASTDSDGDGLTDDDEVNVHGTDPTDPNTDDDCLGDADEVALNALAGLRDPAVFDDPPPSTTYEQDFNVYPDGWTILADCTVMAGTAQVIGGALQLTTNTNSNNAAFHIPPRLDTSQGWHAKFDYTVIDNTANAPADGFSFSTGNIPFGALSGQAEEGWPGFSPVLSFEMDSWMVGDAEVGPAIGLDNVDVAFTNGDLLADDTTISGVVSVWVFADGTANFISTGALTNAQFHDVVTGFTPMDSDGFAFAARTGGANEEVLIDNIRIATGNPDADGDGLPYLVELEGGLDLNADDFVADTNGDGIANIWPFVFGLDPAAAGPLPVVDADVPTATLTAPGTPRIDVQNHPNTVDFCLIYSRNVCAAAGGLTVDAEFSADMVDWEPNILGETILASDGTVELVKVNYPLFLSTGRKARFWHLVITAN